MAIKCACGNEGCGVILRLMRICPDSTSVDIQLDWKEENGNKSIVIELDANAIVELIRELKSSLIDIT